MAGGLDHYTIPMLGTLEDMDSTEVECNWVVRHRFRLAQASLLQRPTNSLVCADPRPIIQRTGPPCVLIGHPGRISTFESGRLCPSATCSDRFRQASASTRHDSLSVGLQSTEVVELNNHKAPARPHQTRRIDHSRSSISATTFPRISSRCFPVDRVVAPVDG